MESFTLAAIALALVSKATEKVGETLGEGAIASTKRLLALLRRRPDTMKRLEAAGSSAGEPDVIEAEILEEAAAADPEIRAAVEETATAVREDRQSLQNVTKLAEKIGVVNLGTVINPKYDISI